MTADKSRDFCKNYLCDFHRWRDIFTQRETASVKETERTAAEDAGKVKRKGCWERAEKGMLGKGRERDAGINRERDAWKVQRKGCWESAEKGMQGKC